MDHVRAMAQAIRREDARHLITAHLSPELSTRDLFPADEWVDFNLTYTYGLVHGKVMFDYLRTPPMPTVLAEAYYEGEHDSTTQVIRRQAYAALLNGAAGQLMGNRPIWLFDQGWRDALDGPASRAMEHLLSLFLSRKWPDLAPDLSLVTEGYGNPRAEDFISAARTQDGSMAIIYIPTARTITVDLSTISGQQANASWFNPRSGRSADIGTFEARATRRFRTPESGDWALVLDSVDRRDQPLEKRVTSISEDAVSTASRPNKQSGVAPPTSFHILLGGAQPR
jgi:hypothetical protein